MIDESLPASIISRINKDDFFFMQIGANDGISFDPIRRWIVELGWHGILFEPQPECIEKLQALYGSEETVEIVPLGIAVQAGTFRLYRHKYGSGCYSMLLRREHTRADDYLEISCITFNDALSDYGIEKIDLLVIDTEGLDLEILDSIDLSTVKPSHIWFEKWPHDYDDLSRPQHRTALEANQHVIQRYIDNGYRLEDYGANLFLTLSDSLCL